MTKKKKMLQMAVEMMFSNLNDRKRQKKKAPVDNLNPEKRKKHSKKGPYELDEDFKPLSCCSMKGRKEVKEMAKIRPVRNVRSIYLRRTSDKDVPPEHGNKAGGKQIKNGTPTPVPESAKKGKKKVKDLGHLKVTPTSKQEVGKVQKKVKGKRRKKKAQVSNTRKSPRLEYKRIFREKYEKGNEKRPNYVEELNVIDFNNDEVKVKFLHCLGLDYTPKEVPCSSSSLGPPATLAPLPVPVPKESNPKPSKENGNPATQKSACNSVRKTRPSALKPVRAFSPDITEDTGYRTLQQDFVHMFVMGLKFDTYPKEPVKPTAEEIESCKNRLLSFGCSIQPKLEII